MLQHATTLLSTSSRVWLHVCFISSGLAATPWPRVWESDALTTRPRRDVCELHSQCCLRIAQCPFKEMASFKASWTRGWRLSPSLSSLSPITRIPACGEMSSGPHRHKHTTGRTNDTTPQSVSSPAAWRRVTGQHCHGPLEERTTMGSLCESTDHFTSTSPGLLM